MDVKLTWRNGFLPLVALFVCAWVVPAYADIIPVNLIVNGGFEDPAGASGSQCGPFVNCIGFHNGVAGNDNIGGWQLIGKGGMDGSGNPIPGAPATILVLGSNYTEPDSGSGRTLHFHPQEGLQSVDLTGEGNQGTTNGIKQSIATNPGTNYRLSFWLGHQNSFSPGYREGPAGGAVYIDGQVIGLFVNSGDTLDDVTWNRFSYDFTAFSPQTVVAFLNDTPVGNNYAGLDNVSMFVAPEPVSFVVVGTGIAWLAVRLRRKR